jgi:hypothetical protein
VSSFVREMAEQLTIWDNDMLSIDSDRSSGQVKRSWLQCRLHPTFHFFIDRPNTH